MELNNIIKKTTPHIIAVLIFLVITIIYFYPVLEGKVLHTNDATVALNSSKEIIDFRARYGEEPLWTNSMFSGMPAYLISTLYSGNIIKQAHVLLTLAGLPISSIFLSMAGFYLLLLFFKDGVETSVLSSNGSTNSTFLEGLSSRTSTISDSFVSVSLLRFSMKIFLPKLLLC